MRSQVGSATEMEMKEKKARVEDALHATRTAVEERIVPGGGAALIRALKAIGTIKGAMTRTSASPGRRAMAEPLWQIVANADLVPNWRPSVQRCG